MFFEHDLLGKPESTFRDHALETIIDACAHHVHLNAGAVGQGRNAGGHDSIVDGALVDIEIFKLCAPVRTEREFGATADGPAARRRVLGERGAPAARGCGAPERDASEGITAGGKRASRWLHNRSGRGPCRTNRYRVQGWRWLAARRPHIARMLPLGLLQSKSPSTPTTSAPVCQLNPAWPPPTAPNSAVSAVANVTPPVLKLLQSRAKPRPKFPPT